jgi:predicted AAA+ superfamily ATPase
VEIYPEKQFIATGSSSFDLANTLNEPLTGRNFKFTLYALSVEEIKNHYDSFFINDNLENLLIYGSYPEVFSVSENIKQERLNLLS